MNSTQPLATLFSFNRLFTMFLLVSASVVAWCLVSSLAAPIRHLHCPLISVL